MVEQVRQLIDPVDNRLRTPRRQQQPAPRNQVEFPRLAGHGWAFGLFLLDFLMWGYEPRSGEARSGVDESLFS
jgi:hypothetical protein